MQCVYELLHGHKKTDPDWKKVSKDLDDLKKFIDSLIYYDIGNATEDNFFLFKKYAATGNFTVA